MSRAAWASLTDGQLLAQCAVDTYRASGPGGQKRNKTSSAVRLRHAASGLMVIAEESRSQHENKARALGRLRRAFFLELREPLPEAEPAILKGVKSAEGKLVARRSDPQYFSAVAVLLDLLEAKAASTREAAAAAGTTTANLVDFLAADDNVWRAVNAIRTRHGRAALHA